MATWLQPSKFWNNFLSTDETKVEMCAHDALHRVW